MVFFTLILFVSDVWFKDDSQLFQVIAGLLTGVTASFLTRIKPTRSTSTSVTQVGATGIVAKSSDGA